MRALVRFEGSSDVSDDDATLTGDLLEIAFDSERGGATGDLYVATRANVSAPWSTSAVIAELSTANHEDAPWLSSDGLVVTLRDNARVRHRRVGAAASIVVFASPRAGSLASVNTDDSETDPWLSPDLRTIVFTRGTNQARDIYFAHRP